MDQPETTPQIIVDGLFEGDISNAASADWIRWFDGQIHAQPDSFAQSLKTLDESATTFIVGEDDVELDALQTEPIDPKKLIKAFFARRFDKESEYDATTTGTIKSDATHTELLAIASGKTSYRISTGKMSTTLHNNDEAVSARDNVRRSSLGLYIKRVIEYRAANPRSGELVRLYSESESDPDSFPEAQSA